MYLSQVDIHFLFKCTRARLQMLVRIRKKLFCKFYNFYWKTWFDFDFVLHAQKEEEVFMYKLKHHSILIHSFLHHTYYMYKLFSYGRVVHKWRWYGKEFVVLNLRWGQIGVWHPKSSAIARGMGKPGRVPRVSKPLIKIEFLDPGFQKRLFLCFWKNLPYHPTSLSCNFHTHRPSGFYIK